MARPTILVSLFAALLLFLSSCDPTGDGVTAFGEEDLGLAVTGVAADLEDLGTAFEGDLGVGAISALPGDFPGASSLLAPGEGTLSLRFIRPSEAALLPRGIWAWDDDAFEWVKVGASDDLVLLWSFMDATNATRTAAITIDWAVTTQARDVDGDLVEVPTAMNVTTTVDTTIVIGDLRTEFDWHSAAACTEGILEPDRVYVDGSFGVDATLALGGITLEITPTGGTDAQIAFSGEVVASAEGDRAGLDWDVTLTGPLTRAPDCFIEDFKPESGAVDVLLFSEHAGVTSSFGVDLTFDDVSGEFAAVGLDGELAVNGTTVVSFGGTLDDDDGDGIPGDDLVLMFANGDTTTLEAFIEGHLEAAATTAMRVLSLFR